MARFPIYPICCFFLLHLAAAPASAHPWRDVERHEILVEVRPDGVVEVVETLEANVLFPRSVFERRIPLDVGAPVDGWQSVRRVEVLGVEVDGVEIPHHTEEYWSKDVPRIFRIKVAGRPHVREGMNTFRFRYRIEGGLEADGSTLRLSWPVRMNVGEGGWPPPKQARLEIRGPGVEAGECVAAAPAGAACALRTDSGAVVVDGSGLRAYEVTVRLPASAVALTGPGRREVPDFRSFHERSRERERFATNATAALLLVTGAPLFLWMVRRGDFRRLADEASRAADLVDAIPGSGSRPANEPAPEGTGRRLAHAFWRIALRTGQAERLFLPPGTVWLSRRPRLVWWIAGLSFLAGLGAVAGASSAGWIDLRTEITVDAELGAFALASLAGFVVSIGASGRACRAPANDPRETVVPRVLAVWGLLVGLSPLFVAAVLLGISFLFALLSGSLF